MAERIDISEDNIASQVEDEDEPVIPSTTSRPKKPKKISSRYKVIVRKPSKRKVVAKEVEEEEETTPLPSYRRYRRRGHRNETLVGFLVAVTIGYFLFIRKPGLLQTTVNTGSMASSDFVLDSAFSLFLSLSPLIIGLIIAIWILTILPLFIPGK